jgi:ABC-type iron transport system FetAB permease component
MRTLLWIGALLIIAYFVIRLVFNVVAAAFNILWIIGLLLLAWWIFGQVTGRNRTRV